MSICLEPQNVSKTVWYYEDPRTLHFIVECRDESGNFHKTLGFRVPIRKLKKSIARIERGGTHD